MIGKPGDDRTGHCASPIAALRLVPTIPAENPEPEGTRSAMYKPDWIDPELGESIEESDEQEAIQEGMF
jgi:hypothetical protein